VSCLDSRYSPSAVLLHLVAEGQTARLGRRWDHCAWGHSRWHSPQAAAPCRNHRNRSYRHQGRGDRRQSVTLEVTVNFVQRVRGRYHCKLCSLVAKGTDIGLPVKQILSSCWSNCFAQVFREVKIYKITHRRLICFEKGSHLGSV